MNRVAAQLQLQRFLEVSFFSKTTWEEICRTTCYKYYIKLYANATVRKIMPVHFLLVMCTSLLWLWNYRKRSSILSTRKHAFEMKTHTSPSSPNCFQAVQLGYNQLMLFQSVQYAIWLLPNPFRRVLATMARVRYLTILNHRMKNQPNAQSIRWRKRMLAI